jgi:hypothetical protein
VTALGGEEEEDYESPSENLAALSRFLFCGSEEK